MPNGLIFDPSQRRLVYDGERWVDPDRRYRVVTAALIVACVIIGLVLGFVVGRASADVPGCIGNKRVKVAPYTCTSTRTIDGTTFSIVLAVSGNGQMVVSYKLDAPRPADTPIRVRAHRGKSSNDNVNETAGVIRAGQTSGLLTLANNCGQVDVKAVYTGNGDARGRVAGPWVTQQHDCQPGPTTSAPAPTTSPTTPGPGAPVTTAGTSPSVPPGGSTVPAGPSPTLPATGSPGDVIGWLMIVGSALVIVGLVVGGARYREMHGHDS